MFMYQNDLYRDLLRLVDDSEAFYFKDFESNGLIYRIFNYRLASYTEFLKPGALQCRGTMFEMAATFINGTEFRIPVRLSSLPMEKFFNLNENPITMGLNLKEVEGIDVKADGSLISTYIQYYTDADGIARIELRLKSKGSIASEQCIDAMEFLQREENAQFAKELRDVAIRGYTINMEWCAPQHRIVLGYEAAQLPVLNVRDHYDGEYVELLRPDASNFPEIARRQVNRLDIEDKADFIDTIPNMVDIEGFVLTFDSGLRVKIKTNWYLALHHSKDSINSPRRLFEAVLEEATDDLRSLFTDDPLAIKMIEEMEAFVEEKYNHMVDTVEQFYEQNRELIRKDYAILGQKELNRMFFGLAMMKYVGKEVDYKAFMKSKWKEVGLKDQEVTEND